MKKKIKDIPAFYGKKVKEFRHLRKFSQQVLAQKANLHITYISSVERGERNISIINVGKIALALNFPMKDFFPEL